MKMTPEHIAAREKYYEEKRLKKRKSPLGVKNSDIEIALRRLDGNMSKVAEFLGVDVSTISIRCDQSDRLREVRKQVQEEFLDTAETELRKLVKSGNPAAVFFVLKTLGKNRGYTERTTVEHEVGPYAQKSAAGLIEAMRKGAAAPAVIDVTPKLIEAKDDDVEEAEYAERELSLLESGRG